MNASGFSHPASLHNVFVYGSLLADEVVRVLLKRVPESSPAILNGYHRFSIKGRVYPAILPVENKKVTGRGLWVRQKVINPHDCLNSVIADDPELNVLDTFEDVEYARDLVEVSLIDSSRKLHVYTYVWRRKNDPSLYGDWNFEEWKQAHFKDFLEMTMGFVDELEQPESRPRVATYESFFQRE